MAIEDAGALGIVLSPKYAQLSVSEKLKLYEMTRKGRASRVQKASARARTDLSKRIGWSSSEDFNAGISVLTSLGPKIFLYQSPPALTDLKDAIIPFQYACPASNARVLLAT